MNDVPHCLIINLDQTGMKLVPAGDWTMAPIGSKRVEITGLGDKRQITCTFAGSLDGYFLPMQILYQGKTTRCHPHITFPEGFDIYHTPNHWANEETALRYIDKILLLYVSLIRQEGNMPDQRCPVDNGLIYWPENNSSIGEIGGE